MRIAVGEREGKRVFLDEKTRSTHVHVIGSTGSGKTKFLEQMVRDDIRAGHGVCFIDPHGEAFADLLDWLHNNHYQERRKIHLVDLSDPDYCVGFNPLCDGPGEPIARVNAMVRALEKVWGSSFSDTPRLSRLLQLIFYTLAHHRLSVLEADVLTTFTTGEIRRRLTEELPEPVLRRQWEDINEILATGRGARQFLEFFESVSNRLTQFATSPAIRPIMGQTDDVIDFRRCMDEGHIVLVNLSSAGRADDRDAQALGAMLFSELFRCARGRDPQVAKDKPFYCYVDECADYLTDDIARILDQTRKFGLHLTLAHQRMHQLGKPSEPIYSGVMESARTKVVFNLEGDDSAEIFARHLFRNTFDLEEPKRVLDKPVTVGYETIWLESEADAEGQSESQGASSGSSAVEGLSQFVPDVGEAAGQTTSTALANVSGSFSGSGRSSSRVRGRHQAMQPILEMLPTATYNLEELTHRAMVALRTLPERHAYLYRVGGRQLEAFTTLPVTTGKPLPSHRVATRGIIADRSGFTRRRDAAEKEIARRHDTLYAETIIEDLGEDDETSFWVDEE